MNSDNLLSDIKNAVNKMAKSAQKKIPIYAEKFKDTANRYGQIGKEKITIKLIDGKIEVLYRKIGKYIYEHRSDMTFKAATDKVKGHINEISRYKDKIEKLEQEIDQLNRSNAVKTAKKKRPKKAATPKKKAPAKSKKTTAPKKNAPKKAVKKKSPPKSSK